MVPGDTLRPVARKKLPGAPSEDRHVIGGTLRALRRAAGFRAVADAASATGCPAARQTIYAYERGGLVPSLAQFLDLVEFYALGPGSDGEGVRSEEDLRVLAVAAVARALTLRTYHVGRAHDLMARLQPPVPRRRGDG